MIERTLVLVKPDGVQRGLIGRIIQRFEDAGFKIVAAKMSWIDEEFAKKHYYDIEERHGEKVMKICTDYIKSGPVFAMVMEGVHAIDNVRKIAGDTYPNRANPGTIRGDFAHISKEHSNKHNKPTSNLIHASANKKDAENEIKLWFKPEEMHTYKTVHEVHTL